MISPNAKRTSAVLLSLSAIAFAGRSLYEGYTETAVIPTKGDVPTVGLGSTFRDDGSRVELGDKITPPQAIRRAIRHGGKDEAAMHKCFGTGAMMYQWEWDAYSDIAYNVGASKLCGSSIVRKVKSGQYEAACNTILEFHNAAGRDCRPRNSGCYGVWTRRQDMAHLCLTGEYPAWWGIN